MSGLFNSMKRAIDGPIQPHNDEVTTLTQQRPQSYTQTHAQRVKYPPTRGGHIGNHDGSSD